jgi:hypothetical protein
MQAFRKYGTNGEWSLYGHHFLDSTVNPDEGGPTNYPWSAYWSALANAANTTSPDNTVPTLTVSVTTSSGVNSIIGSATHPEGVRCIEWERRSGTSGNVVADSGAVKMNWAAENITNVTPGFYANKPMSFGEAVSGAAGSWYVVTATSFLGTQTSRVIQAPGAALTLIYEAHLYGATGDGITDDAASIQAAIDAAIAAGGAQSVHVRSGTYMISTALTFGSNITLYGDAAVPTIIRNLTTRLPDDTVMLEPKSVGRSAFVVQDITFDQRADYFDPLFGYTTDQPCIDMSNTLSSSIVQDCDFDNIRTVAVFAAGDDTNQVSTLKVRRNEINASYGNGILLLGKATSCTIDSNVIDSCQDDGIILSDQAAVTGRPNSSVVSNNIITNCATSNPLGSTPTGIRLYGATSTSVTSNSITNTYTSGIVIQAGAVYRASSITMTSNTVSGAGNNTDGATVTESFYISGADTVTCSANTSVSNTAGSANVLIEDSTSVTGIS